MSGQQYFAFSRPGWSYTSDRRPGTVLAAAIITWILTGVTLVLVLWLFVGTLVSSWDFYDEMAREDSAWAGLSSFVLTLGLTLTGWCIAALVFAYFAFRRRNWARIGLVVSSGVTAFVTAPGVVMIVPLIWTASAVSVIVLLFTGGANDWFRFAPPGDSGRARRPKAPPRELPKFY